MVENQVGLGCHLAAILRCLIRTCLRSCPAHGTKIEGYVFDRRAGKTLADSFVRLMPKDGGQKMAISYAEIAALAFTGRDMAAGNNWEAWVRHYWEKKAAGESNISLQQEKIE